jgi:hypothetical protein
MIKATEIKHKAERKYIEYLRDVARGNDFASIEIPCDKKPSTTMDEYQKEFWDILSL